MIGVVLGTGVLLAMTACTPSPDPRQIEVLHFWTSGGEARALRQLKARMQADGYGWRDLAVAGGAGDNAKTVLKTRLLARNPPAAAQINMPAIAEWGREGVLAKLDAVAAAGRWDEVLPPMVGRGMKYDGHYVAVPFGLHRINTLFVNPEVFQRAGARIPTTWEEFFTAADKIRAAGLLPLAHGGQPWQDAVLFQAMVLGVGGPDFYRRALVDLDRAALASATMLRVFEQLARLRRYIDADAAGRDWNIATGLVISGRAGMQIMGDWAKGEFAAAGKQAGSDYLCLATPGSGSAYLFQADSFAMFDTPAAATRAGQERMAALVMSPAFQEAFNLAKGSIPARRGIPAERFDDCARHAIGALAGAERSGTLLPGLGMVAGAMQEGAVSDVITEFLNSTMKPVDARLALVRAITDR